MATVSGVHVDAGGCAQLIWLCDSVWVLLRDGVGSSSGGLPAGSAVPDTDSGALDSVLSAELAHVAGVLCDLSINVSARPAGRGLVEGCALPSS
jgi:hypothetical protein